MEDPTTLANDGGGSLYELRRFVVALARKIGCGRVDPEDVAQDVLERWLRLSRHAAAIDNPRAWMSIVLRHLVYDRLRRQRVAATNAAQRVAVATYADEVAPWWCELDTTAVRTEL